MIDRPFSHYRVIDKLGGGLGVVYRAEDTRRRRSVAMKILPPELTRDEEANERFIVEAQADGTRARNLQSSREARLPQR